ncbi:hypothetical protein GOP47_0013454 [Adiantum capillus-veneris]|uniref:Uncharacterized protein n=1 Tax=Adiantum capillus-veneris TaxID=13818 RepID=A0A9D4UNJ6_ADICA|nr:hypothetical protein GOP47_0013454 [Adiantum capillus-veneris]
MRGRDGRHSSSVSAFNRPDVRKRSSRKRDVENLHTNDFISGRSARARIKFVKQKEHFLTCLPSRRSRKSNMTNFEEVTSAQVSTLCQELLCSINVQYTKKVSSAILSTSQCCCKGSLEADNLQHALNLDEPVSPFLDWPPPMASMDHADDDGLEVNETQLQAIVFLHVVSVDFDQEVRIGLLEEVLRDRKQQLSLYLVRFLHHLRRHPSSRFDVSYAISDNEMLAGLTNLSSENVPLL